MCRLLFSFSGAGLGIGRVFTGIGVGMVSVLVPTYISETAPTSLRGSLGACVGD